MTSGGFPLWLQWRSPVKPKLAGLNLKSTNLHLTNRQQWNYWRFETTRLWFIPGMYLHVTKWHLFSLPHSKANTESSTRPLKWTEAVSFPMSHCPLAHARVRDVKSKVSIQLPASFCRGLVASCCVEQMEARPQPYWSPCNFYYTLGAYVHSSDIISHLSGQILHPSWKTRSPRVRRYQLKDLSFWK